MSDRLDEFRRQRALLREHLAWLEREIAALEGNAPPAHGAERPYAQPPQAQPPAIATGTPVSEIDAESILAEYRQPPVSIQKRARLGCLLYFFGALAIIVLSVAVLYMVVKRAHAH